MSAVEALQRRESLRRIPPPRTSDDAIIQTVESNAMGTVSRYSSGSLTDSQASALRNMGEATVWKYSPLVGLVEETTPDGRSTSYTYNDSGKAYQVLNDLGEKISTNLYSTDNRQQ